MPTSLANTTSADIITTDVVIIGAGPAGLFAAFELGLHGLKAHIIDVLPFAGGQCVELFGHKPIYDIPGIKQCTGIELTERLLEQIKPFSPPIHLGQMVAALSTLPQQAAKNIDDTDSINQDALPPLFQLRTTQGLCFQARSIILATGVGAFIPRTLNLPGLNALEYQQVFYQLPHNFQSLSGKHVVFSGDLEETLQAVNAVASLSNNQPASVTLVHRRDKFRAENDTIAQMQALCSNHSMRFIAGQFTALVTHTETQQLTAVEVTHSSGETKETLSADVFFILHGLSPKLGPIAEWGLTLKGKQLVIDMATYQTSTSGIFAIGDAVIYPGKRKLIISSFHEATIASYGVASYLQGGAPVPLQYTSSSAELQALLLTPR